MPHHNSSNIRRRRLLRFAGVSGVVALAGCTGLLDDDPEDPAPTPTPTPEPTPTPVDALERLVQVFDDQPFNEAQFQVEGEERSYTPRHVWKFVSEDSFIGLHFNDPNPEQATAIDYVTVGRKGLFTAESRPDAEFTHFHRLEADNWEAGHGGAEGDEGYWLTHIAVRNIQYPFHDEEIGPRIDYEFMPTMPPEGSTGHTTDFTSPGGDEGSLQPADRDGLLEVFTDEPFNEAQFEIEGEERSYTPRHVWFETSPGIYLVLHFNDPNPEQATELDYVSVAVEGQFTFNDIPAGQHKDFTHFHQLEADGWEAGHGGADTDDEGLWLVHHNVRPIQYPFHDEPIPVGVDREFMPTPAPDSDEARLQQLVDIFDDQPFNEAQFQIEGERRSYTPRHVWKFVSEDSFIGLHFNDPNPEQATAIDYITIGTKGLFTEESKPDTEFTHFHQLEASSWEAGHGGAEGAEGYWLTHIATREIQYPFHDEEIGPRVDYEFMPTAPPEGSTGHSTDFTSPGEDEGSLSAQTRDALLDVFTDPPFSDEQLEVMGQRRRYTPRHIWFEVTDGVYVFMHFSNPNPEQAADLDYFGIGVEGQFTVGDIPAGQVDDFTHFHQFDANGWEAGHGGADTDDEGLWLVHHNVRPIQYPFHDEPIPVGVDREFMPTPAPDA